MEILTIATIPHSTTNTPPPHSFGSDTISPYDILTNYTNRRQSTRRPNVSPGNRRGSNLSTSAPRDLGGIDGKREIVRPSSLGGGGFEGRKSASDTIHE